MCKPKVKAPDTSAAEAEAARQREAERVRFEQQRADDERRFQEQQRQRETQATQQRLLTERQLLEQQSATARSERQQREAESAAATRAERERQAAEEAARTRAANMEAYTTGRTARVNDVSAAIDDAYKGFDDNYFTKFSQDFVNYYTPQIAQQYDDARKQITYKYADQGGLNSSAASQDLARLLEKRRMKESEIASNASTAAQSLRGDIDTQRRTLLGEALSASNIGPEVLPEGVADVNGSLSAIAGKLAPYSNLAKQRASGITTPSYSELGSVFGDLTGGTSGGNNASIYSLNTDGLYQPKASGSVRIVT